MAKQQAADDDLSRGWNWLAPASPRTLLDSALRRIFGHSCSTCCSYRAHWTDRLADTRRVEEDERLRFPPWTRPPLLPLQPQRAVVNEQRGKAALPRAKSLGAVPTSLRPRNGTKAAPSGQTAPTTTSPTRAADRAAIQQQAPASVRPPTQTSAAPRALGRVPSSSPRVRDSPDLDRPVRTRRHELLLLRVVCGPQDGLFVRLEGLAERRTLCAGMKRDGVSGVCRVGSSLDVRALQALRSVQAAQLTASRSQVHTFPSSSPHTTVSSFRPRQLWLR